MALSDLISFENPVFESFAFWSAALALKMLAMSGLTALQRVRTRTFANPEDALVKGSKVKFDDPNVERVRRAHRNDLENILVFFPVGFLYVLTNPSASLAILLFRIIGISRIAHTIVYAVFVVPQPARAISFFAAFLSIGYMALQIGIKAL